MLTKDLGEDSCLSVLPRFLYFVHYALKETKADTALPFHITESFMSISAKVQTRLQLHMSTGYLLIIHDMCCRLYD